MQRPGNDVINEGRGTMTTLGGQILMLSLVIVGASGASTRCVNNTSQISCDGEKTILLRNVTSYPGSTNCSEAGTPRNRTAHLVWTECNLQKGTCLRNDDGYEHGITISYDCVTLTEIDRHDICSSSTMVENKAFFLHSTSYPNPHKFNQSRCSCSTRRGENEVTVYIHNFEGSHLGKSDLEFRWDEVAVSPKMQGSYTTGEVLDPPSGRNTTFSLTFTSNSVQPNSVYFWIEIRARYPITLFCNLIEATTPTSSGSSPHTTTQQPEMTHISSSRYKTIHSTSARPVSRTTLSTRLIMSTLHSQRPTFATVAPSSLRSVTYMTPQANLLNSSTNHLSTNLDIRDSNVLTPSSPTEPSSDASHDHLSVGSRTATSSDNKVSIAQSAHFEPSNEGLQPSSALGGGMSSVSKSPLPLPAVTSSLTRSWLVTPLHPTAASSPTVVTAAGVTDLDEQIKWGVTAGLSIMFIALVFSTVLIIFIRRKRRKMRKKFNGEFPNHVVKLIEDSPSSLYGSENYVQETIGTTLYELQDKYMNTFKEHARNYLRFGQKDVGLGNGGKKRDDLQPLPSVGHQSQRALSSTVRPTDDSKPPSGINENGRLVNGVKTTATQSPDPFKTIYEDIDDCRNACASNARDRLETIAEVHHTDEELERADEQISSEDFAVQELPVPREVQSGTISKNGGHTQKIPPNVNNNSANRTDDFLVHADLNDHSVYDNGHTVPSDDAEQKGDPSDEVEAQKEVEAIYAEITKGKLQKRQAHWE